MTAKIALVYIFSPFYNGGYNNTEKTWVNKLFNCCELYLKQTFSIKIEFALVLKKCYCVMWHSLLVLKIPRKVNNLSLSCMNCIRFYYILKPSLSTMKYLHCKYP